MNNVFKMKVRSLEIKKISAFKVVTKLKKGLLFIPIVTTKSKVFSSVRKFFKAYKLSILRYVEYKQYRLKNEYNLNNKKYFSEIKKHPDLKKDVKENLPNMIKIPTFEFISNDNAVLNVSEFFDFYLPDDKAFYNLQKVKEISGNIFHDTLSHLAYGEFNDYIKEEDLIIPERLNSNFHDTIIFSYEVENIDNDIINKSHNVNVEPLKIFKREKNNLSTLSILRGLLNLYSGNLESNRNLEYMNKDKNIIFIIHNKKHLFLVDINHLRSVRKMKYNEFRSSLVKCFKYLIAENAVLIDRDITTSEDINNEIDKLIVNATRKSLTNQNTVDSIKEIIQKDELEEEMLDQELIAGNEIDEDIEDIANDNIDDVLDSLDEISEDDLDKELDKLINEDIDEEEDLDDEIDRLKELEKLNRPKYSKKQIERMEKAKSRFNEIKIDNRTAKEILNDVKAYTIDIEPSNADVNDESMNEHLLLDFDKSYIKNTMNKHILEVANSFSGDDLQISLYLQNVTIEDTSTTLTDQLTYKFELEDNKQKRHSFKVDFPKIDKDGFMLLNGSKKNLKKQILSLPIVKETHNRVSIMSNYNKCMVTRVGTIPNRNSLLLLKVLDEIENNNIKGFTIVNGNNSTLNKDYYTTIEYNLLSERLHRFEFKADGENVRFMFNQQEIGNELKKMNLSINNKPKEKKLCIGFSGKDPILVDMLDNEGPTTIEMILGYIEASGKFPDFDEIINDVSLNRRVNQRMHTIITFQSKKLPLVIFLASIFGLDKVLSECNIKYEISDKPIRDHRRVYRFKDKYLAYSEEDLGAALLLNGLSKIKLIDYDYSDMNTELPYLDYFQLKFKSRNLIKGFKNSAELMFRDPITLELLRQLELPTEFLKIFLYGNELLTDDEFTHNSDVSGIRIRSYEILAVLLYKAMCKQYILMKQRTSSNIKMSIPQNEIMTKLHYTGICENFYKLNPLSAQKAKSELTYKGIGISGINDDQVFTLGKRSYGKNAIGIYTLANTDSGKVGIVKKLSHNPRITSTLGIVQPCEGDHDKLTYNQIHGPSECAIPFIEGDSPPRTTFMDGQTKHTTPTIKNRPYLPSNGYSKSVVEKLDSAYVKKSSKKGIVTKIENNIIVVTYKDETVETFDCNTSIEKNEDFYLEVPMKINVNVGDKVDEHTVLAYNNQFVYKNSFGELELAQGPLAMCVLTEGDETEEDSSILFEKFANDMATPVTNGKSIVIDGSSNILSFKKIGDKVKVKEQLVSYENAGNVNSGITELLGGIEGTITDEDYASLLTKEAKSNMTGTIVDIDVYFTIPIEEMSESCADFVHYYFSILRKRMKNLDKKSDDYKRLKRRMEVTEPVKGRIKTGLISEEGGLFIEYFISHLHPMLATDKLSVNSSIKSVIQAVVPDELAPIGLETGTKYDAVIGSISISNRKVTSVFSNGFIGTIIRDRQKEIASKFLK